MILCITAITFLLRVLVALVKEATTESRRVVKDSVGELNSPEARAGLVVIPAEAGRVHRLSWTDERMAF